MKLSALLCAVALLIFASCLSRNKEPHRPTSDPTVYKGVINPECAVEMQYGSYGAGIDDSAYTETLKLMGRWNVEYTSKNIGREGETRLCMPLAHLKKRQKNQFIDTLKRIAKHGKLVSVSIR